MNESRESYVRYWSMMTGKSRSEIYVPASLQPGICYKCGWTRPDGTHTGCSRGKW